MRSATTALVLLLVLASSAAAQRESPDRVAQVEAMARLGFLLGDWQGTGWMQAGPQKSEFSGHESIRSKVDGLAILVEGAYTAKLPDGTERTVHESVGLMTWDAKAGNYSFATKVAAGFGGDYVAKLVDDATLEWTIPGPQREMRYTIHVEGNTWTENGTMSTDGGDTWVEFFEMTLERQGEP